MHATSVPRRRFTLRDAMVLVVASALGFLIFRVQGAEVFPVVSQGYPDVFGILVRLVMASIPLVAALALALLFLRISPRQFSRRRLARQPGFIACLMIAVGAVFCLALLLFVFLLTRWINTANGESVWEFFVSSRMHSMLAFFASHIGCAIVAAWISLRLARRWRPEPDWIDRTGRILGAVWVGASLFCGALFSWMSN